MPELFRWAMSEDVIISNSNLKQFKNRSIFNIIYMSEDTIISNNNLSRQFKNSSIKQVGLLNKVGFEILLILVHLLNVSATHKKQN